MSDLLKFALSYVSRGWPVVPIHSVTELGNCTCGNYDCRGPGKHPFVEHAHRFASTDRETVKRWCEMYPKYNLAVASGRRSGLIVLDIDPRHLGAQSLHLQCLQNGALPKTPRALTGGGGEHYLFSAPQFEVRGRIGMHPGIDVRAEDQLFIVPPSRHKSGQSYRWDDNAHPDTTPLSPIPHWLLTQILSKQSKRKSTR